MVRVISGRARGRKLLVAGDVRPTSDRVKESVFNILGAGVEDRIFLDLFAGSGSMGIEALSRGAPMAVFVEKDPRAARILLGNLKKSGFSENGRLYRLDVLFALKAISCDFNKDEFLVYADPPFGSDFCEDLLKWEDLRSLVPKGGRLLIEHPYKREINFVWPWSMVRRKRYGRVGVSFFENG